MRSVGETMLVMRMDRVISPAQRRILRRVGSTFRSAVGGGMPAGVVGARLGPAAAGGHVAPRPGAVAGVVVERPPAGGIPARLQPAPGPRSDRGDHNPEQPSQ